MVMTNRELTAALQAQGNKGIGQVGWDEIDPCRECGAIPGTDAYGTVGDGFDGLCPSCADKAEPDDDE